MSRDENDAQCHADKQIRTDGGGQSTTKQSCQINMPLLPHTHTHTLTQSGHTRTLFFSSPFWQCGHCLQSHLCSAWRTSVKMSAGSVLFGMGWMDGSPEKFYFLRCCLCLKLGSQAIFSQGSGHILFCFFSSTPIVLIRFISTLHSHGQTTTTSQQQQTSSATLSLHKKAVLILILILLSLFPFLSLSPLPVLLCVFRCLRISQQNSINKTNLVQTHHHPFFFSLLFSLFFLPFFLSHFSSARLRHRIDFLPQ